jgi:glycosyltransferase involved in cell wall biosynthesis
VHSLIRGGTERVVSTLADWFAENGDEAIVATEEEASVEYPLHPAVRRVQVGLRPGDEGGRFRQTLLRVKYLRELIKTEKPDIVLAFGRDYNYRALMAKTKGVPVIISIRNPPLESYRTWQHRAVMALLHPRAAGCVFQTAGQRAFFPKRTRQNSRIILNPLNPKYVGVLPPTERKKEVVHAGNLANFKNQAGIVRSFIRVHADYPEYVLKLYGRDRGEGTKENLERIIAENQAEGYVYLMGASDALERELADAAMFVFNSDWEGLPNSLMEAMALGLPVIATDCPTGGPAALISDGVDGLLIPIKDDNALEQAMRRLLADPIYAETLGKAARRIGERCRLETIARQWSDYIVEVTASHRDK